MKSLKSVEAFVSGSRTPTHMNQDNKNKNKNNDSNTCSGTRKRTSNNNNNSNHNNLKNMGTSYAFLSQDKCGAVKEPKIT